MTRYAFWGVAAFACAITLTSTAYGQMSFLNSEPHGIRLSLEGPITVAGNSPLPIDEIPPGEYQLAAEAPGLPSVKGRLINTGTGLVSRSWAGPSALLYPPGFVHLERGEKRGWVFMLSGGASATMAIVKQASVRNAEDKVNRAVSLNGLVISEEALLNTRLDVVAATNELNDEEEVRNLWVGYLAYTWAASAVETWLLTPQPKFTVQGNGTYSVRISPATGWGAAIRSALVPGSGQRYMGRDGRGNFFSAGVALGAAGTIVAHDQFLTKRREQADVQRQFLNAETEDDIIALRSRLESAASSTEDANIIRWSLLGITGGIYLWNIIDSFALGNQAKANRGFSWTVAPTSDGFLAAVSWSMQ